jgi:putative endonuclease
MSYTVYILYSVQLNKFYIGHTGDDIDQRFRRHLAEHSGFTSKAKDWRLVYHEIFSDKRAAARREREIKNWKSSIRIRTLVGM